MTKQLQKKEFERLDRTEERRRRVKEKLCRAKAVGAMTADDEADILRYALGVVTGRVEPPQD